MYYLELEQIQIKSRTVENFLEYVDIFRRPLDARGVSRDTPRMYGQTLKKK